MLHMSGHIYYRLGQYEKARRSFIASMHADEAYMKAQQVHPIMDSSGRQTLMLCRERRKMRGRHTANSSVPGAEPTLGFNRCRRQPDGSRQMGKGIEMAILAVREENGTVGKARRSRKFPDLLFKLKRDFPTFDLYAPDLQRTVCCGGENHNVIRSVVS